MSQEDVENARRGYAVLNEAYRAGDPSLFRPMLEAYWDPDAVFQPAGVLPDRAPGARIVGWEGILQFIGVQMEAFSEGWLEASEFVDRGEYLLVPYRFGGRARHTRLPVEFSFVHLITLRDGKVIHMKTFQTKAEALEAAGLS